MRILGFGDLLQGETLSLFPPQSDTIIYIEQRKSNFHDQVTCCKMWEQKKMDPISLLTILWQILMKYYFMWLEIGSP